jgi:hypothetical protein
MAINLKGSVHSNDKGKIIANYAFSFKLSNKMVAVFDAKTTISTIRFSSKDVLVLTSSAEDDLHGSHCFWGIIGGGKIQLEMKNGTTIEGPIEGGPIEPQSTMGIGTWTRH